MSKCGIKPCAQDARWRVVVRVWPLPYQNPKTGELMDRANAKTPSMYIEAVTNRVTFATLKVCDHHMVKMPGAPGEFYVGASREALARGWDRQDWVPIDWDTAEWEFRPLADLKSKGTEHGD